MRRAFCFLAAAWLPALAFAERGHAEAPGPPPPKPALADRVVATRLAAGAVFAVRQGEPGLARQVAAFRLRSADTDFGGLSGLLVEGDRLAAVGDRGLLWTARLAHDPEGRLEALSGFAATAIMLPGARRFRPLDCEALTRLADGRLVVALEDRSALLHLGGTPSLQQLPEPLRHAPENRGAEVATALPGGRILVAMEGQRQEEDVASAALIGGEDGMRPLGLALRPGFQPTDAAVAGGRLFLLQRRVSLLGGLRAAIVAFPLARLMATPAGAALTGETVALIDGAPLGANFEGLAAVSREDGATDLYLVSDDDFGSLLSTVLVQLRLPPPPPRPAS